MALVSNIKLPVPNSGELLSSCNLCPRKCNANRFEKAGLCRLDHRIKAASVNLHTGEEPPVSGTRGSGTIFFSGCNMSCVFCQNYPISQLVNGRYYTVEELSDAIVSLEKRGAHNINLVTASHLALPVSEAIRLAKDKGLSIPVLYNSSGYDSLESLSLLEGLIDIYMPDIRYQNSLVSERLSGVKDYPEVNKKAISEMFRQVGHLVMDDDGIAIRGLLIRHLVLPHNLAETETALKWICENISNETYISLMSQYFPAHLAVSSSEYSDISRRLTEDEYNNAVDCLEKFDMENGWIQPYP
jgi:putative pyruvate formate lyase activating enzyme